MDFFPSLSEISLCLLLRNLAILSVIVTWLCLIGMRRRDVFFIALLAVIAVNTVGCPLEK